jgi:hypothetical protein
MKRHRSEFITDAIEMLTAAGAQPRISDGGRHIKVYWSDRHGHRRVMIVPRSPSDWRARANARAVLRRLLRNAP